MKQLKENLNQINYTGRWSKSSVRFARLGECVLDKDRDLCELVLWKWKIQQINSVLYTQLYGAKQRGGGISFLCRCGQRLYSRSQLIIYQQSIRTQLGNDPTNPSIRGCACDEILANVCVVCLESISNDQYRTPRFGSVRFGFS